MRGVGVRSGRIRREGKLRRPLGRHPRRPPGGERQSVALQSRVRRTPSRRRSAARDARAAGRDRSRDAASASKMASRLFSSAQTPAEAARIHVAAGRTISWRLRRSRCCGVASVVPAACPLEVVLHRRGRARRSCGSPWLAIRPKLEGVHPDSLGLAQAIHQRAAARSLSVSDHTGVDRAVVAPVRREEGLFRSVSTSCEAEQSSSRRALDARDRLPCDTRSHP